MLLIDKSFQPEVIFFAISLGAQFIIVNLSLRGHTMFGDVVCFSHRAQNNPHRYIIYMSRFKWIDLVSKENMAQL